MTGLRRLGLPLTLTLLGLALLLVAASWPVTAQEPEYRLYLPLVLHPGVPPVTFTEPASWGLAARGADLAAAAQATAVTVTANPITMFAWNSGAAPPWSPQYTLTRGFVAFELTSAPAGIITQAHLELYPWAVSGPTEIEIYQGLWTGAPTAADWDARGELLATVAVTSPSAEPHYALLPLLAGQPVPPVLYLVLRSNETLELAPYQSLGAAFGLRETDGFEGAPVSKLHLWIAP